MRVLHFFKTYWPDTFGGIERTIHALAEGSSEHGIKSNVLSLSKVPKDREFGNHMAYKARLDFEFASTGFSRDVFCRFRDLSAAADIVHYHFPWPWMDVVHSFVDPGKPTLVTYHSDVVKQKILLRLYRPLMKHFLESVDHIVTTSPNYLASSGILQRFKSKTSVIPLGLDETSYPAANEDALARWRRDLPPTFFLFVGVLRYYKGAHILLEASRISGLPVVIVGEGPMEVTLKETARQQALSNIFFLGALPDIDKAALLELCLGVVFPSHLRSEAFGLTLVESAMFGKPMISCEIGTGTSYVNLDGETGLVIPPANPAALAAAMTRLANDPVTAIEYGSKARLRYLQMFTAKRMVSEYAELYRMLAERKDMVFGQHPP
ncbi:glycosyltransferase [Agrobacterium rhizogenes]|jgi:rhamnosyl/mannosyltransferase|uniref:glycosyltransferase n=1 Tax=Rhizobium rhizogenes TaxID=359 RepID=UPI001573E884|nr:glycosyltransferase [Rhizobium rhizogenes]NTG09341.1 glycosyltransferase [Rhizobium rhizogenes]NTG36251.1 glycosyltransferase [Rhizobium rhizogenes]NTG55502.1 glycosyltransferase [Rhizobium rhizogenes]NTH01162.1 glycosyltransferase [Rhizobium rhizogenes]NTI56874.1 glycosyltransferase [Rhizobium rhizogenes]